MVIRIESYYLQVITAGVMTGTNTLTGVWVDISLVNSCSFIAKWTGTPNGSFTFDVSNDSDPTASGALGATALPLPASFAAGNPAGTATSYPFDFGPMPYKWVRIKYLNGSSTGTLDVKFNGKG